MVEHVKETETPIAIRVAITSSAYSECRAVFCAGIDYGLAPAGRGRGVKNVTVCAKCNSKRRLVGGKERSLLVNKGEKEGGVTNQK